MITDVFSSSCKVPVFLLRFKWILNFLNIFSKRNIKNHRKLSSKSRVVPCRKTDGRTNMRNLNTFFFSQFLQTLLKSNLLYTFSDTELSHRPALSVSLVSGPHCDRSWLNVFAVWQLFFLRRVAGWGGRDQGNKGAPCSISLALQENTRQCYWCWRNFQIERSTVGFVCVPLSVVHKYTIFDEIIRLVRSG